MKQLLLLTIFLMNGCASTKASEPIVEPQAGQYAEVNGIRMYYETYGEPRGIPLVLLHGGGSTIDVTWGRILPFLKRDRYVIALEEQGHGRTQDRNAPFRFATSAEDVAALLKTLNISQADIFGFSNGASVALALTLKHPQLVHKLVFASSMTKRSGATKGFFDFFKNPDFKQMPQPLKDAFLKVNPDPARLRNMFDKDVERMLHFQETADRDVKNVQVPTLILLGDHDVVTREHGVELSRMIKNSRLIILEGTHGEFLGEAITGKPGAPAPRITAELVNAFLRE